MLGCRGSGWKFSVHLKTKNAVLVIAVTRLGMFSNIELIILPMSTNFSFPLSDHSIFPARTDCFACSFAGLIYFGDKDFPTSKK